VPFLSIRWKEGTVQQRQECAAARITLTLRYLIHKPPETFILLENGITKNMMMMMLMMMTMIMMILNIMMMLMLMVPMMLMMLMNFYLYFDINADANIDAVH
jgi:hypothetical protein